MVLEGEPTIVALANGWVTINAGGGPTEDKPTVTLETPPRPGPREQLPQHPRRRHRGDLRRLERTRRRVSDRTGGPRPRDPLLRPRPGRAPHRDWPADRDPSGADQVAAGRRAASRLEPDGPS